MHAAIDFYSETQSVILPKLDCAHEKYLHGVKNSVSQVVFMKNDYSMGDILKKGYFSKIQRRREISPG
ncbi:hypothetical protein GILI108418_12985 [Gillisia limnaea]|uniref:Uncharacterized protein n=2 Tax=Gillisia TaxID=244698 RepID=H2BXL4_GILLR|nr:hypothetical protein Gilli_2516 [Gillisia limnaea DSM 15749]